MPGAYPAGEGLAILRAAIKAVHFRPARLDGVPSSCHLERARGVTTGRE